MKLWRSSDPTAILDWHVLGAVLRALRGRPPLDVSAHLSAKLPLLVRGAFYDQWHPAAGMSKQRHQKQFLAHVDEQLKVSRPVHTRTAAQAVFGAGISRGGRPIRSHRPCPLNSARGGAAPRTGPNRSRMARIPPRPEADAEMAPLPQRLDHHAAFAPCPKKGASEPLTARRSLIPCARRFGV